MKNKFYSKTWHLTDIKISILKFERDHFAALRAKFPVSHEQIQSTQKLQYHRTAQSSSFSSEVD